MWFVGREGIYTAWEEATRRGGLGHREQLPPRPLATPICNWGRKIEAKYHHPAL